MSIRDQEDTQFVTQLSEANRSSGVVDPEWTVQDHNESGYICKKNGLRLVVAHAMVHSASMNSLGQEVIAIRFPAERRHWMPSFYCTAGGTTLNMGFRLYFNVKPSFAVWLLRTITEEFELTGTSYQFKLLNNPVSYRRSDAAVLYLDHSALAASRELIARITTANSCAFRNAVPALTRKLHPGIAIADEPPQQRDRRVSFGEHRCRLIARALARAHLEGNNSTHERLSAIYREFAAEGIDADRPYSTLRSESLASEF